MKNYHTHCNLCKHAKGKIIDYVNFAIKSGFTVLGISDHAPTSNKLFSDMRMDLAKSTAEYFNELKQIKLQFERVIDIRIGLECEYLEDSLDLYSYFIQSGTVDYLIGTPSIFSHNDKYINIHNLSQDYSKEELINSYFKCLNNIATSNLFKIIGEPDLFYILYSDVDKNLKQQIEMFADLCKENNKLIELNGLGIQRRKNSKVSVPSVDLFWSIVKEKQSQVILGADAHSPEELSTFYCLAALESEKYELTNLVVDTYGGPDDK